MIAANMKLKHPDVMVYEGTLRQDDNTYIIYFSYTGFGLEAPSQRKVNQFNVYLVFLPN